MLKRILTKKRFLKQIFKEQKGITGLETAIILIAFVVVAAVFAYTVLSAGLFSTQKSQEAVYSGLQETQNTLVVKGGVLSQADPKAAETCDVVATYFDKLDETGAVLLEETEVHQGVGSLKVTATAAALGDTLAYKLATVAVLQDDTITFWAKLADAGLESDLAFAINSAAAGITTEATTQVTIDADDTEWHLYSVDVVLADEGDMYFGIYAVTDALSGDVYIDDIQVNNVSLWDSTKEWTPYASDIILTLSLATGGQPVDFSPGSGSSAGLWTAPKTNKMVVNYNDSYSHFTDVVWSATWIGNTNGDYMLDPGEKIKLTISLDAVNATSNKVDANHQFTLEIKSPKGAVLSFERTMPARLYGIDNLN
ncbi:MAG: hypothetical protein JXA46_12910 [Dehalococcoidales bacterium]|nr:hypothetical protein [Dehalococcoidales bacterium]